MFCSVEYLNFENFYTCSSKMVTREIKMIPLMGLSKSTTPLTRTIFIVYIEIEM